MSSYSEKLQDPRWLCRRAEIIAKNEGCCDECGRTAEDEGTIMQVHHIVYVRGREPWEYPDDLLLPICKDCHTERQIQDEEARYEFSRVCRKLGMWQVHDIKKALRLLADDGRWEPVSYDAYEAIRKTAQK